MPTLFIRFFDAVQPSEDGPVAELEWLTTDQGVIKNRGITDLRGLEDLVDPVDFDDPTSIVLIVPTELVVSIRVSIPGRTASQIRRGLPYALEEYLTDDLNDMHVASGAIRPGEAVDCMVLPKTLLEDWLAALEHVGLKPGKTLVDGTLLGCDDGAIGVLFEGERVLVSAVHELAAIDRPNLITVLETLRSGRPPEERPVLQVVNGDLTSTEIEDAGFGADQIEKQSAEDGVLAHLVNRGDTARSINLLQGEFAPRRKGFGAVSKWQPVAVVALGWVVLAMGLGFAEGWWAQQETSEIRNEAEGLYKSIYGQQRVSDPGRQMRQRMGQISNGEISFRKLVGRFAKGVGQSTRDLTLASLTYTEAREEIALSFTVGNLELLDELKRTLEQNGMGVVINSTEKQEDRVLVNMRLGIL